MKKYIIFFTSLILLLFLNTSKVKAWETPFAHNTFSSTSYNGVDYSSDLLRLKEAIDNSGLNYLVYLSNANYQSQTQYDQIHVIKINHPLGTWGFKEIMADTFVFGYSSFNSNQYRQSMFSNTSYYHLNSIIDDINNNNTSSWNNSNNSFVSNNIGVGISATANIMFYYSNIDITLSNVFEVNTPIIYNGALINIGDNIPMYIPRHVATNPTLTINGDDNITVHINDFDEFTLPTATAYDTLDGDISNLIVKTGTLAKLVGDWYVDYKVCNSNELCTTKRVNITVTDGFTDLVLLADRAVMFIPKNYSTFDFNDINFQFFNKWTYVFYDLDTKEIIKEGIANSKLEYGVNNSYKFFEWKYHYILDKNIHFGILFTRFDDIALNGVVRYKPDIYNYRFYTEWTDTFPDIPYVDYDSSDKNINIDNIDIPTLQDDIELESSFFNDFNTNFFGLSDIITMPLDFLRNLTTSDCTPFVVNSDILSFTFPCMSTIYEESFPDLLALFRLITDGIVSYYVIVNTLRLIKQFKDPENDRIEVYSL